MRPGSLATLGASLVMALGVSAVARAADTPEACPPNKVPPIVLPLVKKAVAANKQVMIVALGSSTTEGWRASNIAHSYPALLQADLNTALPTAHVVVINRGNAGEDVIEELPRIGRDAISLRPTLVIWQLGANGAMRNIPVELYKRLLTAGVKRLQEANTDVLLMDNQRAPAIMASPEHILIDQATADVAAETGAKLFARGALMDQWREAGYPYERFVSDDRVHHNDYGYKCVSAALSAAIVEGLNESVPTSTQTAAKH
jgi:lysophospholipase L1-like esterase